jgi:hypothetical protein
VRTTVNIDDDVLLAAKRRASPRARPLPATLSRL